jgi:hypothetical protein
MASEIRVDKITSLSGVGTISPSPTGVEIAGITTVSTLKVGSGTTIFPSGGLFTTNNITIDRGAGDGSSLRLISSDNDPDYKLAVTDGRFEIQDITNSFASRFAVDTDGSIKVGSGVTLSPDGDIFATGISTFKDGVKVGSGVTLSPDGDIFATGISTFKDGVTITSGSLNILNGSSSDNLNVTSANNTLGIFTSTDSGANIDLFDDTAQSRIRTVSGSLHLYADFGSNVSNSAMRFFVDGSDEKARILSTGGITFNGDTATANALDDYEEGDYLPSFTLTSGSITLDSSRKTLCYTKIGRQVTIIGQLKIDSVSSPSGVLRASLPFNRGNQTEQAERTMGNIMVTGAAVNNANEFATYPDGGTDSFLEIISISGTVINRNGGNNMQAGAYIYVNYTYFAA